MELPRAEYPRPQFVRNDWLNLNGTWQFAFDDADAGERQHWWLDEGVYDREITVPYVHQASLSGIGDTGFHDVVWYRRGFEIPGAWQGRDVLLHFGAVDYRAKVWVNGRLAAEHTGGHTPFSADLTPLLTPGVNVLVVRAEDPAHDLTLPRGKQYWREHSAEIFYTRTTGIWQTVWLEPVAGTRLHGLRLTPDAAALSLAIEAHVLRGSPGLTLRVEASYQGEAVAAAACPVTGERTELQLLLPDCADRLWSPEHPHLFDLRLTLRDAAGAPVDAVHSYFGLRSISTGNGQFRLNGQPYFQRLVLDQGYWPESILTPPSDAAICLDIELTKALGFNGVRKHQKVEDPRYLYWADRLGLLVWAEMANAREFSPEYVKRFTREWMEAVQRQYNHPCVVAWVPINESWGVPHLMSSEAQRQHLLALYHLTRSLDQTRPVSTNDGWENPLTDLLTIHDYAADGATLRERYSSVPAPDFRAQHRTVRLPGFAHGGEPLLISEFGGIAFQQSTGWGYSVAADGAEFVRRYQSLIEALAASPAVTGWCYTQLTDVEQETNGLLTYDRKPKVDPAIIRRINTGRA